jgi:hypothetical protein
VPAHFSFNGVNANSVVSVKAGAVITGTTPTAYTKLVWFRRDTVARTDNLISASSPLGQSQHFLYFVAEPGSYRLLTAGNAGGFARILSDAQTSANQWQFGAVRFSTTDGFSLYLNTNVTSWSGSPSLITSSPYEPLTDALSAGGLGFNIGRWQSGNSLEGDVATALAYDVDIGDAAVKSYFASTVGRFYPAT